MLSKQCFWFLPPWIGPKNKNQYLTNQPKQSVHSDRRALPSKNEGVGTMMWTLPFSIHKF